ncbi:histone Octamer, chromosomal Protein, alpha carbons only, partial [Mycena galericulata]
EGSTKPTLRRLARRGGVKRISGLMYAETRGCLYPYMEALVRDTVLHTTHGYRTTINQDDVLHALRRSGRTLYI